MDIEPKFPIEKWDSKEKYEKAGIVGYEPMTAKELDTEEAQDRELNNSDNYIEEKFDGTRALVHFFSQPYIENGEVVGGEGWCRVFSRRISKKTGFYVENSDSVPQIRDIDCYNLGGTVLDGEMFIPDKGFHISSAIMNCKYDEAIRRQEENGYQVFHAFDILFFKGIDLRDKPLRVRKMYLRIAVAEANSPYIQCVKYYSCGKELPNSVYELLYDRVTEYDVEQWEEELDSNKYPNLYNLYKSGGNSKVTPRSYYELIVSTGGEGVIVKPKEGKYLHKRGWEYSKIKSFLTRELILVGFDAPTREYTGKAPKDWEYYEGDTPVTKYYARKQVGNMILGVLISMKDYKSIPEHKRGTLLHIDPFVCKKNGIPYSKDMYIMTVCECSGYTEEEREYFTKHKKELIFSVVEVKANGLMKDSGKLRHPRFLRLRPDKGAYACDWVNHLGGI